MLSLKMEKGPHKVGAELVQGVLFMDAQDMDRKWFPKNSQAFSAIRVNPNRCWRWRTPAHIAPDGQLAPTGVIDACIATNDEPTKLIKHYHNMAVLRKDIPPADDSDNCAEAK